MQTEFGREHSLIGEDPIHGNNEASGNSGQQSCSLPKRARHCSRGSGRTAGSHRSRASSQRVARCSRAAQAVERAAPVHDPSTIRETVRRRSERPGPRAKVRQGPQSDRRARKRRAAERDAGRHGCRFQQSVWRESKGLRTCDRHLPRARWNREGPGGTGIDHRRCVRPRHPTNREAPLSRCIRVVPKRGRRAPV